MAVATGQGIDRIAELLGDEASTLLEHESKTIDRSLLHLPGPDFVDRVVAQSDRSNAVLRNLQLMFDHGRLGGTGFMSVLPVDQGIEHSAGASFAPNPAYFDPENIVELAIEGGCNAVASTIGVLGAVEPPVRAPDPVHREDQPQRAAHLPERATTRRCTARVQTGVRDGRGRRRRDDLLRLRAVAPPDHRGERGVRGRARARASSTVLWCYLRNSAFKKDGVDYHVAADLTGQANHLGVTIEADIIKQKLPENNGGYTALNADGVTYGLDEQEGVLGAHERQPDRPHALPGRQLLHGPRAA